MLQTLDSIIHWLGFLTLDQCDPKLSRFGDYQVPTVIAQPRVIATDPFAVLGSTGAVGRIGRPMVGHSVTRPGPQPSRLGSSGMADGGCSCARFQVSSMDSQSAKLMPLCLATPAWDPSWSLAETQYEEHRRLAWCALTLATAHLSYTHSLGQPPLDLAITNPGMFRILFPGETLFRGSNPRPTYDVLPGDPLPKDSVWALYARGRLLYASAVHIKDSDRLSQQAKAEFAVHAWLETERIEAQLDRHTCNVEKSTGGCHIYSPSLIETIQGVRGR